MPYDESLADRIRIALHEKHVSFEEKKMMGGLCFMVDDKMCIGVGALTMKGCREMDFTGRPMRGYVFVESDGIETDHELKSWVQLCLDFNPKAKSSKKKKK